jgi:hypothetical protein
MPSIRPFRLLAAVLALAGCSDAPVAPPGPGSLRVTVVAQAALESNVYPVKLNDVVLGIPASGEPIVAADLEPGEYTVEVSTPTGCTVFGGNPRTASVVADRVVEVTIEVDCGGTLRVVLGAFGDERDDYLDVIVDGVAPVRVAVPDSVDLTGLVAGEHAVSIGDVRPNCGPLTLLDATAPILPGQTTRRVFVITCDEQAGNLRVIVSTTGAPPWTQALIVAERNSYTDLPLEGEATVWQLPPGTYHLEGTAGCGFTFGGSVGLDPESDPRPYVEIEHLKTTEISVALAC